MPAKKRNSLFGRIKKSKLIPFRPRVRHRRKSKDEIVHPASPVSVLDHSTHPVETVMLQEEQDYAQVPISPYGDTSTKSWNHGILKAGDDIASNQNEYLQELTTYPIVSVDDRLENLLEDETSESSNNNDSRENSWTAPVHPEPTLMTPTTPLPRIVLKEIMSPDPPGSRMSRRRNKQVADTTETSESTAPSSDSKDERLSNGQGMTDKENQAQPTPNQQNSAVSRQKETKQVAPSKQGDSSAQSNEEVKDSSGELYSDKKKTISDPKCPKEKEPMILKMDQSASFTENVGIAGDGVHKLYSKRVGSMENRVIDTTDDLESSDNSISSLEECVPSPTAPSAEEPSNDSSTDTISGHQAREFSIEPIPTPPVQDHGSDPPRVDSPSNHNYANVVEEPQAGNQVYPSISLDSVIQLTRANSSSCNEAIEGTPPVIGSPSSLEVNEIVGSDGNLSFPAHQSQPTNATRSASVALIELQEGAQRDVDGSPDNTRSALDLEPQTLYDISGKFGKSLGNLGKENERDEAQSNLESTKEDDDHLKRYEEDVQRLQDKLDTAVGDKGQAEKTASEAIFFQYSLEAKVKKLEKRLLESRRQVESSQDEFEALRNDKDGLNEELLETRKHKAGSKAKSALEVSLRHVEEDRLLVEMERVANRERIESLEKSLEKVEKEPAQLQKLRTEDRHIIEELREEMRDLKLCLDGLESEKTNLEKLRREDESRMASMQQQLREYKGSFESLESESMRFDELRRADKETMEELKSKARCFQLSLQSSEQERSRLEARAMERELTIERLQVEQRSGSVSNMEMDRMHQELSRVKQENVDMEATMGHRKAEYYKDVKIKEVELLQYKTDIENFKQEVLAIRDQARKKVASAGQEIRHLRDRASEYDNEMAVSKKQRDKVMTKLESMEHNQTQLSQQLDEKDDLVNHYRSEVTHYKEELSSILLSAPAQEIQTMNNTRSAPTVALIDVHGTQRTVNYRSDGTLPTRVNRVDDFTINDQVRVVKGDYKQNTGVVVGFTRCFVKVRLHSSSKEHNLKPTSLSVVPSNQQDATEPEPDPDPSILERTLMNAEGPPSLTQVQGQPVECNTTVNFNESSSVSERLDEDVKSTRTRATEDITNEIINNSESTRNSNFQEGDRVRAIEGPQRGAVGTVKEILEILVRVQLDGQSRIRAMLPRKLTLHPEQHHN